MVVVFRLSLWWSHGAMDMVEMVEIGRDMIFYWSTTTREDGINRLAPIHTQSVTLRLFSSAVKEN